VDLGVAEQKLKVQEATVALHQSSDRAKSPPSRVKKKQAQSDVEITKSRIAQMEIRRLSPVCLVFSLNYSQAG